MYYDPKKIAKLCPSERQIAAMQSWVQNQSERVQRRFARFKVQVEKYWRLYPWLRQSAPTAKNDLRSLGGGGSSSSHHSTAALGSYLVICLLTLMSCRSQQIIVPNDTVTYTNRQTKSIARDSVYCYERDSMAVSLRAGAQAGSDALRAGAQAGSDPSCYPCGRTIWGLTLLSYPARVEALNYPARVDTLVIERWHTHYKDRWLTRIDTLMQHDTTVVTQTVTQTITEKVRYVPAFYKWCVGILVLIILFIIWRLLY